jgi:leukotriene-A4 hydrolase
MRALDVSTLALTMLTGGIPWLFACASAPRPAAAPAVAASAAAVSGGAALAVAPAEADPHSFARPAEVAVEHLVLDLSVDFEAHRLSGRASLRLRNKSGAGTLYLDTRDLDIQRVTLADGKTEAPFTLGDPVPYLGRSLAIRIPPGTQWVNVEYATAPDAEALQWLTPVQAGSQLPLLFTQSEAILARTWVPCQDTPAVRQTYEATVRVPPGFLALMSAENPTVKAADGIYHFRMPQPVPSYLLALAVGDLAWKPLSDRSGVYALPATLESAAWELADTPRMMAAAEKLYGPYRWGRYDLLVLPPSYPYGGMENPRLTFATPTILAGDRSLVSLVAHELAHSWSGNLVTNASWNDVWINEGFTVYLERRIMEALYGRDYADMLAVLGRQDLEDTLREKGPESPDTRLHLDLAGRDPDDGVSNVPYEKGALLLATIEASVGRERFDRFLRGYFDAFAFQSMDSRRFVVYLETHLLDTHPGLAQSLRLDEWVNGPGLPATAITVRSAAFARVDQAVMAFAQGTPAARLDTKGWTTHHWLRFLRNLPQPLTPVRMAELDAAFHFTGTGNDEMLEAWLVLAIRNAYAPADAALERFLIAVGRRKYLQPLYAELAKTPAGAETALRIYARARPGYHPVAQAAVDKILDWRG